MYRSVVSGSIGTVQTVVTWPQLRMRGHFGTCFAFVSDAVCFSLFFRSFVKYINILVLVILCSFDFSNVAASGICVFVWKPHLFGDAEVSEAKGGW